MPKLPTAVFPGSFDPITLGHIDIINRALPLFDSIIIAIGENTAKKNMFSLEKRKKWIADCFKKEPKIAVKSYKGLTVDFCKKNKAKYILRGLRSSIDFEYEKPIAQMNKAMEDKIETLIFISQPQYAAISSSIVRDIIQNKGNASKFLPPQVKL